MSNLTEAQRLTVLVEKICKWIEDDDKRAATRKWAGLKD